jgi:hypothetical protein
MKAYLIQENAKLHKQYMHTQTTHDIILMNTDSTSFPKHIFIYYYIYIMVYFYFKTSGYSCKV